MIVWWRRSTTGVRPERESCPGGHFTYDPTRVVRSACVKADLERPGLLLAGIGVIGMGAALLMLPETGATRDLDTQVLPVRVTVRRRFGW